MSEEEKEAIDFLNNIEYIDTSQGDNAEKLYDSRDIALILINRLQKENEELKEENIILEGNKIGLKLAIQELEKTIDLIIDDFQAENYFVGMTNKEVREYYKKRKELKE